MQGEELQHQWLSLSGQAALVMALRALHCITLSSASPDSSNKTGRRVRTCGQTGGAAGRRCAFFAGARSAVPRSPIPSCSLQSASMLPAPCFVLKRIDCASRDKCIMRHCSGGNAESSIRASPFHCGADMFLRHTARLLPPCCVLWQRWRRALYNRAAAPRGRASDCRAAGRKRAIAAINAASACAVRDRAVRAERE